MAGRVVVLALTGPVLTPAAAAARFHSFKTKVTTRSTLTPVLRPRSCTCWRARGAAHAGLLQQRQHGAQMAATLAGRSLTEPATLQAAATALQAELVSASAPGLASAAFRVGLAVNLLYKFLHCRRARRCSRRVRSRCRCRRTRRLLQATGRAIFCDGTPPIPTQLYAAFVLASGAPRAAGGAVVCCRAYRVFMCVLTAGDIAAANGGPNLTFGSIWSAAATMLLAERGQQDAE
jgi:hypothetical protein